MTTTHLKCADDLKSLEKESSLSLAACTCFSKVDGVRQFLLIDSAVGTRTAVDKALKLTGNSLPRYDYTTLPAKKNKLLLCISLNSRIKETRSGKPVLATK